MEITAVSHWLEKTAEESFLSTYPIKCIYNGIDMGIFYPRSTDKVKNKYGITHKKIILGVASDWSERKGLKLFNEISKCLNENEVIVLVGLRKAQIDSLPNNIIGIERTESKDELAELYSSADIFVNASKEETFGLVTAEALACGTRAIVFDSTACAEVLTDSHCGVAVKNNSELILSVKTFLEKSSEKSCVISRLDEKFKAEKMIKGYINEYGKQ